MEGGEGNGEREGKEQDEESKREREGQASSFIVSQAHLVAAR